MNSVEVEIFGRKYKLKGDDPDKLRLVTESLNEKLNALSSEYSVLNFEKLLLLCALQLQEKVYEISQNNEKLKEELERMNNLINAFLPDSNDK